MTWSIGASAAIALFMLPLSLPKAQRSVRGHPPGFNLRQRRIADQIVSIFENGTPEAQYGYIENLKDGRGYTAGRAGFTSGMGDLLAVILEYSRLRPRNPLKRFIPTLKEFVKDGDDSTEDLAGLDKEWKSCAHDPLFREAQDVILDRDSYLPAVSRWKSEGCHTALSLLVIYDAVVQQGDSDDPDGVPALLRQCDIKAGGSPRMGTPEVRWLKALLTTRRRILSHPANSLTREEWARSLPRIDALERLLKQNNLSLATPLTISAFGDRWKVK